MHGQATVVDVVVVGGGPAGLSAALCLGRARRSVVVIDKGRPRHAVAEGVHNFLANEGIPPAVLRAAAWEQMRQYSSVRRHDGTVESLERRGDQWIAACESGESWAARAVLLATGVVDQHPDIRGYEITRWRFQTVPGRFPAAYFFAATAPLPDGDVLIGGGYSGAVRNTSGLWRFHRP